MARRSTTTSAVPVLAPGGSFTIATIGFKGGGGKTTTAYNLALAAGGRWPTYLIDVDQTPALTRTFLEQSRLEQVVKRGAGVYNWLAGQRRLDEVAIPVRENLTIIPSTPGLDIEFSGLLSSNKQMLLRECIDRDIAGGLVIIDTHPGPGELLVEAAVAAADLAIIAVQPEGLDSRSIASIMGYLQPEIRRRALQVRLLLCRDNGYAHQQLVTEDISGAFGEVLIPFSIPARAHVGVGNLGYSPDYVPIPEYRRLADEVLALWPAKKTH